jgi:hypothetical protein
VGQKIDLEYNIETMRITDEGGDGASDRPTSSIMDAIKTRSQAQAADKLEISDTVKFERAPRADDVPKISAEIQSTKLKQLLGQIKKS